MKLSGTIEVVVGEVGEEGKITLRQPTNKEWNDFSNARFPVKRGGQRMVDRSGIARVRFFDLLVQDIENIQDAAGNEITTEQGELPDWLKQDVIFRAFENREDIEVKN